MVVLKLFVIPVPIFDQNLAVEAYYFRFQRAENPIIFDQKLTHALDGNIDSKLFELLDEVGLEPFTTGKPIFVPISNINLLGGLQRKGTIGPPPGSIILRLDSSVTSEGMYIDAIKKFKAEGYKFALKLPKEFETYRPLLPFMDYIIVDQNTANKKDAMRLMKEYQTAIFIATHVNTYNMFNLAKASGYNFLEGRFYRTPISFGETEVSPLKMISIQLLNEVHHDDFDIDKVAKLIQNDVALTVSLLRFVNSAQGFGQQINSITHAAAMLGQNEIRKWCSTAASTTMASDKPNEINKLSLIRARFAEQLAVLFKLEKESESLFLMGLFSMLDVILDRSTDEALTLVSVSENIKQALVKRKGPYFDVLEFILLYENCDWTSISRILILNNIQPEEVYDVYLGTLNWYKDLMISFEQEMPEIVEVPEE